MVHGYCNRKNNLVPQDKEELFNITEIGLKQGNFKTNDNSTFLKYFLFENILK